MTRIDRDGGRIKLLASGCSGRSIAADELVVATGFRSEHHVQRHERPWDAACAARPTAGRWRVDVPSVIRYRGRPVGPEIAKGPMAKPFSMTWTH